MEYPKNNKFPYEVFPEEITNLIIEANLTLGFPVEYFASSIISANSIAIGNNYTIKFKDNFVQKCNLFIALVGKPGDGKTHPLNLAYKPIFEVEKEKYNQYKNKVNEYNLLDNELKKQKNKPRYIKSVLNDFTPESLFKLHSVNPKGINIVVDELFGWLNSFGRYNKSSGEQETYLSLWSGNSISVDRKGDEPIRIDNTFVGLIGTLQLKLLPNLKNNDRDSNGFIERMLFALNKNPKPNLWNDDEINLDLLNDYNKYINSLIYQENQSTTLTISNDAKKLLINWRNSKREEYFNANLENHTSIFAKYEVYSLRFAIILHLMHSYFNNTINKVVDISIIEKSILLTEYYFENAVRVHFLIKKINPLNKLDEQQKTIYNSLDNEFETNQLNKIAESIGIPKRTAEHFLSTNKDVLFLKMSRGRYKKIY